MSSDQSTGAEFSSQTNATLNKCKRLEKMWSGKSVIINETQDLPKLFPGGSGTSISQQEDSLKVDQGNPNENKEGKNHSWSGVFFYMT